MSEKRLKELTDRSRGANLGAGFLCLEVNPPRGVDPSAIFSRLDNIIEGVDFLNVTDSALAKMRCAPLPFASLLKQRYGIEALVNISCRDRNVIALQGDILSGWMLGVRSIIALTGDAVSVGDMPQAKGVFELNSIGLLKLIDSLNQGRDLAGNEIATPPSYIKGVVVNPNARNPAAEIKRLERKKEAGAEYALSQPVFDKETALAFFKAAQAVELPILAGLLPFKSSEALKGITSVPGIRISEQFIKEIETKGSADCSELSLEMCVTLAKAVSPYVAGYHVVSGATPKLALRLAAMLAKL
jgi:5,10-methylenetetrahydrofolate reductase